MGGPELERLISLFAKLPGLGPRSARRIVLKLLRERETKLLPLADAIRAAAESVRTCSACGNLDSCDPCSICASQARDPAICVVETVADLWALERALIYRGRYHVLGGSLSALAGRGPEDLAIASLLTRLLEDPPQEIILAMPATVDGAATGHYLAEKLKSFGIPITRLAQGVPMGGSLEVLDEGTLATALRARRVT
ncbi:MAG: recombination protein RecR [Acidocella sp. 20-57-95]|nr:MAG: recombination protein RecR [Acidocella sp. 20-57-95]OYV60247.1 MAG: recombination protein RecR [Acidocella sp. 21-58-7]HQT63462.1 recombination mediator RecR [Acidocella sp.]HQU04848.1 recombination mediator RecR [Acidocella sp.]